MSLLDARARKIAEYAKVNRDRPDFEEAVRAMALAELRAAVQCAAPRSSVRR